MNKQTIFLLFILLISLTTKAQINKFGLPSIKYFSEETYSGSAQNWAIVQDYRGIMYFGNNNGNVLQYDGSRWKSYGINNKSTIRSLAVDSNNIVYVGGIGEFGYIAPNRYGKMQYNCISCNLDSIDKFSTDLYKIYISNNKVYYCSAVNIYEVNNFKITKIIKLPDYSFFSFFIDNKLLTGSYAKGVVRLDKDSLIGINGGDFYQRKSVTDILKFDKNNYLIFTATQGIYKYNLNSGESNPFISDDSLLNILTTNMIYDAVKLNDGNFAIATIYNGTGIIIIDKEGNILNKISKSNGLKDAQITYLYQNNGPLWVTTNNGGIYSINYNSTITSWDEAFGLDGGGINGFEYFNDIVYVATDGGVFYSSIKNNEYVFKQIPDFNEQSWSFGTIVNDQNDSILLVGTWRGIYEIYDVDKTRLLDERILNTKKEERYNDVRQITQLKNKDYVVVTNKLGIIILKFKDNIWSEINRLKPEAITAVEEDYNGNLWLATQTNGIYYTGNYLDSSKNETIKHYGIESGFEDISSITFAKTDNEVIFGTKTGIYTFDKSKERFNKYKLLSKYIKNNNQVFNIEKNKDKYWVTFKNSKTNQYWIEVYNIDNSLVKIDSVEFKQLPNSQGEIALKVLFDKVYFGIKGKAYLYNYKNVSKTKNYLAFIRNVKVNDEKDIYSGTNFKSLINDDDTLFYPTIEFNEDIYYEFPFKENNFKFTFSATFFEQDKDLEYSVFLEGNDDKWSKWSTQAFVTKNNLEEGDYIFNVKSRNIYGEESNIAQFKFTINAPWYRTIWAYILYLIVLVTVIYVIVKLNSRRLVKEKEQLEEIVEERTAEIRQQKEEIEEIHQEITDSIHYAKRIQTAILPVEDHVSVGVPEHFILFKPKDIVSGDFHWASIMKDENGAVERMVVTAADCTGHGVPGAFMSMLGVSFLNEIVTDEGTLQSNEILNEMRSSVIHSLQQTGAEGEQKDGMDLALCSINLKTSTLEFSGANNPLYILRHKDKPPVTINNNDNDIKTMQEEGDDFILYEIKPDKMPIAIYLKMDSFTLNEISLLKGDTVYMFSDGYADQFGGPKGKKFKYKPFKRIFLQNQEIPLSEQKIILDKKVEEWKAYNNPYTNEPFEQVDDIVVIGIKF